MAEGGDTNNVVDISTRSEKRVKCEVCGDNSYHRDVTLVRARAFEEHDAFANHPNIIVK